MGLFLASSCIFRCCFVLLVVPDHVLVISPVPSALLWSACLPVLELMKKSQAVEFRPGPLTDILRPDHISLWHPTLGLPSHTNYGTLALVMANI